MKVRTVLFNQLTILAVLFIRVNGSFGLKRTAYPTGGKLPLSDVNLSSQSMLSKIIMPSSAVTQAQPMSIPSSISGIEKPEVVMPTIASLRKKRDATSSKLSTGPFDIQTLFPSNNIDDEALQKWLILLTKPKTPMWIDDYDDKADEFDPPAIDLVHGRKPGSVKSYVGGDAKGAHLTEKGNEWAGDENNNVDPISLQKHRVNKKASLAALIPELFLREGAASRDRPDPHFLRRILARMSGGNIRTPRSMETDENNNSRFFTMNRLVGQI